MAARRLLGQILKDYGVIHEGMVQEALVIQREKGGRIGEILMGLEYISRADLAKALAEQAELPFLDLEASPPQMDAVQKLDTGTARAFSVLPVSMDNGTLTVAFADPLNASVLGDIA
ncbi:MAG: hypothetical protein V3U11_06035, partial [Planctomycetota bacterium]